MANMMELDGLASVDALFGIAGLKEDLMDGAVLAGAAGVGLIAGQMGVQKLPWLREQNEWIKIGALAAVGIGGGIAIGRYLHRGAGAGFAAGMGGLAIARTAQKLMPSFYSDDPSRDLLFGYDLGATLPVREVNVLPGQDARLAGLGQAGAVSAREVATIPGGGFSDDLAALIA